MRDGRNDRDSSGRGLVNHTGVSWWPVLSTWRSEIARELGPTLTSKRDFLPFNHRDVVAPRVDVYTFRNRKVTVLPYPASSLFSVASELGRTEALVTSPSRLSGSSLQ